MKKFIKYVLILSTFLTIYGNSEAKDSLLKFHGTVVDNDKKESYNQIIVEYNSDDGFVATGRHLIFPKIERNGNFQFVLPDLKKPYQIKMVIYNADASKTLWKSDFYTESKDSIKMQLQLIPDEKSDSAIFQGVGATKYKLISRLNKEFWKDYYDELNSLNILSFKDSTELSSKMIKLSNIIRANQAKKLTLINNASISPEIKTILNLEYGTYYREWDWRTELLYRNNPTYRKQIGRIYLQHSSEFYDKPNKLSSICKFHISSIVFRIELNLMLKEDSTKINIKSFYKTIQSNFVGPLRDRLIGYFVFYKIPKESEFQSFTLSERDSVIRDAQNLVVIPYIKRALLEKMVDLSRISPKSKLIETKFKTIDNQDFDLKSLHGKVFLIDAWFTGCTGCAIFHNAFENEIPATIMENENFAVLSINFDLHKELWLKGVASKKYTSENYINVYTGDNLGLNHPFMKYYNVKGGPYLMLVDGDGYIYYQPQYTTANEMISKITEALTKKGYVD